LPWILARAGDKTFVSLSGLVIVFSATIRMNDECYEFSFVACNLEWHQVQTLSPCTRGQQHGIVCGRSTPLGEDSRS
jgi:hypothetical protein